MKTIQLGIIAAFVSVIHSSVSFANDLKFTTSVSQLKTIETNHWEYQALQSLAQKYSCKTQLQNNGNDRPLSRYEFALGLNNCLQVIGIIFEPQDLIVLQRLQKDFRQEIARLRSRIDRIETNLNQLETNRFSPTTKFNGEVLFFLKDSWGQAEDNSQTFFGYRTRLDFNTSFAGKDIFKVRLESKDIDRLDDVTDTLLSRISVDGSTDSQIEIVELSYTFAPTKDTQVTLGTRGIGLNDIGEVLSPFSSSRKGALSRFARRNPATLRGTGGAGIGIKQKFGQTISASAGYLINNKTVGNPEPDGGLFNSSASAIAQVVFEPEDDLAFALTYTHIYQQTDDVNLMGSTGVRESNRPFGDNATTADNFGLQLNWAISSGFEIGGWFGYTKAQQQANGNNSATILNGALTFAFPDLGAENNLGGIIIGVPPVISQHNNNSLVAKETPLHIEVLYRMRVSKQIEITPGMFIIINPDTKDGNTILVGTVRTKFSF